MKFNILLCFLFIIFSMQAKALIEVPIASVEGIDLTGSVQQLTFIQDDSSVLKIAGYEKAATLKNKTVFLKLDDNKAIEIRGPSVVVNAFLSSAQIQVNKWSKDLKLNIINGKISTNKTFGSETFIVQKGDITSIDHTGSLKTEVYQGNVTVAGLKGDQNHTLFAGNLKIEKNKGAIQVSSFQGVVKQTSGEGSFRYESQRGQLALGSFKGHIEAESNEGNMQVGLIEDSSANLKSLSGKINVQLSSGLGAGINALVKEGDLYLPGDLKVVRTATEKSYHGTYRADNKKSNLTVRSVEGTVVIK